MNEINYQLTNEHSRSIVQGYHRSPSPRTHHIGAKRNDLKGMNAKGKKNIIPANVQSTDYRSKFTIGIEIEKTRIAPRRITEQNLFAGYERDSSCGVEAVTNILPLIPQSKWRNKIFNMMFEAREIIEDAYSPTDYRCGGHITVGVEGLNGQQILQATRKNMGIMYALFRYRLSNTYCDSNLMLDNTDFTERSELCKGGGRYATALVKGDLVEFRLVSRFTSVEQTMRRYELMYELLDFSVNNPNVKYSSFLKKIKPIIIAMYEGDVSKAEEIIELSKHFQKMLDTKLINSKVVKWVDKYNRLNQRWYTSELRRELDNR